MILKGKQISILFKENEPSSTDLETWKLEEKTNYQSLHLNEKSIILSANDSQLIVKKPEMKKAKKLSIGKDAIIFKNTKNTKKQVKEEVLLSKAHKHNQDKIMRFLNSRNQNDNERLEDKSLLVYAKLNSKSLIISLALYFLAAGLFISAPFGPNELKKSRVSKSLEQERFLISF